MPRSITGEPLTVSSGGGGGGGGGGARLRVGALTRRISVTVEMQPDDRRALGRGRLITMVT